MISDRGAIYMYCSKCGNQITEGHTNCADCNVSTNASRTKDVDVKAPGRIFLLVTGIIYIITGVFIILGGIAAVMLGEAADGFILITAGIYGLVIGIMGTVYRNNLGKAKILIIIGIIALIVDIISGLLRGSFATATTLLLAIPICYIAGAYKNKKALT